MSPKTQPRHVSDRLRSSLSRARRLGFAIRFEPMEGVGTDWCEIAGRIHLFVDLHQSSAEQTEAVEAIVKQVAGPQVADLQVAAPQVAGPRIAA